MYARFTHACSQCQWVSERSGCYTLVGSAHGFCSAISRTAQCTEADVAPMILTLHGLQHDACVQRHDGKVMPIPDDGTFPSWTLLGHIYSDRMRIGGAVLSLVLGP